MFCASPVSKRINACKVGEPELGKQKSRETQTSNCAEGRFSQSPSTSILYCNPHNSINSSEGTGSWKKVSNLLGVTTLNAPKPPPAPRDARALARPQPQPQPGSAGPSEGSALTPGHVPVAPPALLPVSPQPRAAPGTRGSLSTARAAEKHFTPGSASGAPIPPARPPPTAPGLRPRPPRWKAL